MRGQRNVVLELLKSGRSITSKEAFERFGITRLSAIICDFRKMGYPIATSLEDGVTRYGDSCKYARYSLDPRFEVAEE
jgi:hypothetical protein